MRPRRVTGGCSNPRGTEFILVDAESGEILDLNPFAERLLGYRRDELVGQ